MKAQAVAILSLRKQSLPIIRALAKIGKYRIYCFVDQRKEKEEAEFTRYGEKIYFSSIDNLRRQLHELQKQYSYKLHIFITSAYLLTEIREEFREIYEEFCVYSSPLKWIDSFTDKARMYAFVEKYGVKTAAYVLLSDYTEGCLKFPLVLKRNLEHILSFKTKLVFSQEELECFISNMPDKKEHIIVQELVQGNKEIDLSYQGYIYKGKSIGSIVLNEVRHFPEGISCFLKEVTGKLKNEVTRNSECFLEDTDYTGFIQIDYKYLELENRLVIMDINTRTPASHSAFSYKFRNYTDLFKDLQNPTAILHARKKLVSWTNLASECILAIKTRNYKCLYESLVSKWDLWSWKDPVPFIMSFLLPIRHLLRKI